MSPTLSSALPAESLESARKLACRRVMAATAWHSLLWLVVANAVGILLAAMLLFPGINNLLGEWTYGRWMPLHINLQLYGWCSLPLVGFLFRAYRADHVPIARWTGAVLWIWSAALAVGSVSWLQGHASGKLFLDWIGYPRLVFPLALLSLWALLMVSTFHEWRQISRSPLAVRALKLAGLMLLLLVPIALFVAVSPSVYPPVNPDSGGPTGASQLESTLMIIAILLLVPFGIAGRGAARTATRAWAISAAWAVFAAECLVCVVLGRADASHHERVQWIGLGSVFVWIPLVPAYFSAFEWHANTRAWRNAFLCWWCVLVPTGWLLFLPGVLDRIKFTDALVAHSLLAMGGFVSSLLIFVLVQLMGGDGWIFNGRWSFWLWHGAIFAYVMLFFYAGWREGGDPAFSMVPSLLRNGIYAARLLLGVAIFIASLDWFVDAFTLQRELGVAAEGVQ